MDEARQVAVERWLIKADHDLITARTMLTTDPPVTDTACFHAQQCMEKCLKAFLVFAGIHVERTHYLPRLVALCAQASTDFDALADAAVELTDYAVADRYPDSWREITVDEARAAVQKAEMAAAFVRQRVNQPSAP